jgi:hypothetical protein
VPSERCSIEEEQSIEYFVSRYIKNWNQLPAEALETCPFIPKIFRNRAMKAITNGVK